MTATRLPDLYPVAYVDGDWADDRLRELRHEISTLEERLSEAEAEIAATEERIGDGARGAGDDAPYVTDVIEVLLGMRRAEFEAEIEDGERAAAETILDATNRAECMVTEARREISVLLRERTLAVNSPAPSAVPSVVPDSVDTAVARAIARVFADPVAVPIDVRAAAAAAVPSVAATVELTEAEAAADEIVAEPVAVPALRILATLAESLEPDVNEDSDTYQEFWRDEPTKVDERRRRGNRVLDTLVPMVALLLVLCLIAVIT